MMRESKGSAFAARAGELWHLVCFLSLAQVKQTAYPGEEAPR
jgi:hypothetical protein